MSASVSSCDLLVISPHTDDAEIGLGGTIALLASQGRSVWCLDLTRGELGTNDVGDVRWAEAAQAANILGLTGRVQLNLPDGFIDPASREQVEAVVWAIRCLRPRWVVTAPDAVRHPDHLATPELVRRAVFHARLGALQPDVPAHRCWEGGSELADPEEKWVTETVLQVCGEQEKASIIFDVTAFWKAKTEALKSFASQFLAGPGTQATYINDTAFLERVERRGRTWGHRAGCRYGEAFRTESAAVLKDLPEQPWRGK